jgi:hypothetical protein
MSDHLASWLLGLVTGVVAAVATRVQLLPDVIDLSVIPTGAGLGSLLACGIGAACRLDPDRLGRVTLLGTLVGGGVTAIGLVLTLVW